MIIRAADDFYLLRPEIAEALFYMYRGTKDEHYRQVAHKLMTPSTFEQWQCSDRPVSLEVASGH